MSLRSRTGSLILTSRPESILDLNWRRFLGECGYEVSREISTETSKRIYIKRKDMSHNLEVRQFSQTSIQIVGSDIRFPIARLLGCNGFCLHPSQAINVAFEIFRVELSDNFVEEICDECVSISLDTITAESFEIVERVYELCPGLLLPTKKASRKKCVFAHIAVVGNSQFLSISSDKYDYDDWRELDVFDSIKMKVNYFGGQGLAFLRA